ncbi:MAG: NTP transferase domain-containing protein [Actinomycetota bacterium]|nr:NTP transferase domain-containing protein [Actinomycetota bacterium]
MEVEPLYALLLTGGRSSRFPGDKLRAKLAGGTLVEHVVNALEDAGIMSFEIGPGYTPLTRIEGTERRDPLTAVGAGWRGVANLLDRLPSAMLVVSGDLGNINSATLSFLARFPGTASVVPFDGSYQPLCARWSRAALDLAAQLGGGDRPHAVRAALDGGQVTWRDSRWASEGFPSPFFDVDTVQDLERLERWRGQRGKEPK